jgi:hypothetical protein
MNELQASDVIVVGFLLLASLLVMGTGLIEAVAYVWKWLRTGTKP